MGTIIGKMGGGDGKSTPAPTNTMNLAGKEGEMRVFQWIDESSKKEISILSKFENILFMIW